MAEPMANEQVSATGDADVRLVRKGIASSAAGFWLVSLSPVIVAGAGIHGISLAFWRSWVGFVVLATIVMTRKTMTWEAVRRTAPVGLCFGASIGLFFWAAQLTSVANASLITVLQPLVMMVGARFMFAEVVTRRDVFWSAIAITGAVTLVLAGDSSGTGDIRGDLLAGGSVIVGAGYFIFGKRVLETVEVMPFMTGVFLWAGLLLTVVVIVSGERIPPDTGADWLRILAVGLAPGLGHVLLNFAQNKAPLNLIGVVQLLVPVNATLMAYFFLDQSVTGLQLVGMALVIGALTTQATRRATST
jgi:drug/metabolite transporter (DMT)-like permease